TGAITKVHIEIIADQKAQLTKYESGGYTLIGNDNQNLTPEDVIRYNSDPQLKKQLNLQPAARTTWIGFNMCEGAAKPSKNCTGAAPFGGEAGKLGREAFSLAVDRDQLVDIACSKGTACIKATGGVITKGLKGYLGDNTDPWAVFDKAKAQQLFQQWGGVAKVPNLVYTYNTSAFNKAVCENLASQWKANLNVTMQCTARTRRRSSTRERSAASRSSGTAGARTTTTPRTGSTSCSSPTPARVARAIRTPSSTRWPSRPTPNHFPSRSTPTSR